MDKGTFLLLCRCTDCMKHCYITEIYKSVALQMLTFLLIILRIILLPSSNELIIFQFVSVVKFVLRESAKI